MILITKEYLSIKEMQDVKSFALCDLVSYMRQLNLVDVPVTIIDKLFIPKEDRNQGHGTAGLKQVVESRTDNVIMIVAGALEDEYPEEPTFEENKEILARLDKFYTQAGFVSVNETIGAYECSHVYIYDNKNGRLVIDECKRSLEEFKKQMAMKVQSGERKVDTI